MRCRTITHTRLLALLSGLLVSCAPEGGERAEGLERFDSAGVDVVVNHRALVEAVPALRLVEDLRIGAPSGNEAQEFFGLSDLAVDGSGRIFALDMSAGTVRVFGADGIPERTIGRQGRGPGEFGFQPLRVAVARDTLLVIDRFSLYLFTTDGRPLLTRTRERTGSDVPPLLEAGAAGWVIGRTVYTTPTGPQDRLTRDAFRISPMELPSGSLGSPLVEVPGGLRWYWEDLGRSTKVWPEPTPFAAVRPNGEIYLSGGDAYRITVLSADGAAVKEIRIMADRVPVEEEDYEAEIDRQAVYWRGAGRPEHAEAFAEATRAGARVPFRPVTGRLLVAPAGRLLVERRDLDPDPSELARSDSSAWDLLDSAGRITGRLEIGPGTRPQELTDDYLYAIDLDELDVQYIVRYRLEPAS